MSKEVQRYHSATPWEKEVGYCRAIRVGNQIFVSGTSPVLLGGEVAFVGDPFRQAKHCFELVEKALVELGGGLVNVVRTRQYVTDITLWREFARAHREAFSDHVPVTSMVEVQRLIDPRMLIEIEAEAVLI